MKKYLFYFDLHGVFYRYVTTHVIYEASLKEARKEMQAVICSGKYGDKVHSFKLKKVSKTLL